MQVTRIPDPIVRDRIADSVPTRAEQDATKKLLAYASRRAKEGAADPDPCMTHPCMTHPSAAAADDADDDDDDDDDDDGMAELGSWEEMEKEMSQDMSQEALASNSQHERRTIFAMGQRHRHRDSGPGDTAPSGTVLSQSQVVHSTQAEAFEHLANLGCGFAPPGTDRAVSAQPMDASQRSSPLSPLSPLSLRSQSQPQSHASQQEELAVAILADMASAHDGLGPDVSDGAADAPDAPNATSNVVPVGVSPPPALRSRFSDLIWDGDDYRMCESAAAAAPALFEGWWLFKSDSESPWSQEFSAYS